MPDTTWGLVEQTRESWPWGPGTMERFGLWGGDAGHAEQPLAHKDIESMTQGLTEWEITVWCPHRKTWAKTAPWPLGFGMRSQF